jgi:hypothetical protein
MIKEFYLKGGMIEEKRDYLVPLTTDTKQESL